MDEKFQKAVPVMGKIERAGFEAYFVGGAIRDFLLNRPINDVDIATSATPMEIKQLFEQTVDIGIEHGTVMVLFQGTPYEITTFRTESNYIDFRRPEEVKFVRSLQEDLKRRDFTMNAIAMTRSGKLIDPFNGQQSILERKIVTVGNAEERFSEDALRIMRALRFVSQLSFTLDSSCFEALITLGPLLNNIAVERKTAEFEKLLCGQERLLGIEFLYKTNVYRYLPGLETFEIEFSRFFQFPSNQLTVDEMWGLLLYCLRLPENEVDKFLRQWKLPIKKIRTIQAIYHWTLFRLEHEWNNHAIYEAGKDYVRHSQRLFNVLSARETNDSVKALLETFDNLPITSRSELSVTGSELMEFVNQPAGPWIKECLRELERMILMGKLENQLDKIREWVQDCNLK